MLYADWRREYHADLMDEMDAGLSWWEFAALLAGLSEHSVWRRIASEEPVELTGDAVAAAIDNL
ncbi:Gp15 family bacteriophage protein [Kutzneria viridogrisea]|uniref:Gp15 family bacteriophage protein n=1 Tax=Kutzneria viridogrisea TaxID=47990 RepID=UPI0031F8D1D7